MLPKDHRLRLDKDIKTLFAKGKSVFGLLVMIKIRPNRLLISRFAVVVGTKISKRAVVRNRIRRQIRSVVENHLTEFTPGFDIVFMPKKEAIGKKTAELEEEILLMFKRKTSLLS